MTVPVMLRAGMGDPILKTLGLGEGTHLPDTRGNLCHWGKWDTRRDLVTGELGACRTAHLSKRATDSVVVKLPSAAVAMAVTWFPWVPIYSGRSKLRGETYEARLPVKMDQHAHPHHKRRGSNSTRLPSSAEDEVHTQCLQAIL